MRLFFAINFTSQEKSQILEVQEYLRSQALKGNFTKPENLHLTMVFLGETPEQKLPQLMNIMEKIHFSQFEINFNHTGCFHRNRTELWWLGADKHKGLSLLLDIHKQLLELLKEAGFNFDTRSFKAHITLGREVKSAFSINLSCPGIIVKVDRISLMKSERNDRGLTYTELGFVKAGASTDNFE